MWTVNYCSLMTTTSGTHVVKLCNTEVSIRGAISPHSLGFCKLRMGLDIAVMSLRVWTLCKVQSCDYVVVLSFLHRWQLGVRNAI
jgi:hypothetical protein